MPELTEKQKETIAEYAAQLGYYDYWWYRGKDDDGNDLYGNNGESLDDAVELIEKQHEKAMNAHGYLQNLGLIDSDKR